MARFGAEFVAEARGARTLPVLPCGDLSFEQHIEVASILWEIAIMPLPHSPALRLFSLGLLFCGAAASQNGPTKSKGVPVTIKELDLQGAMKEFQDFRQRLGEFRDGISEGRKVANETAQILTDLRESANGENNYNEAPIMKAITGYVDAVLEKQVGLVDFLESQRYRISYYANKMAASLRPEELALLFGTEEQNDAAIVSRVGSLDQAKTRIADFVDALPPEEFDKDAFRPLSTMSPEKRRSLDSLLYQYQQEQNALDFAKKRLQIVRAGSRLSTAPDVTAEINPDLLIGQMFGTLDRIRLQMSLDLMYLEQLLANYSRSAQTQEILEAFQNLVEMQGNLEGPSPELAGVLDWLQDSSVRRISLSANRLSQPGIEIPRYSDLLRQAYQGARGANK